MRYGGMTALVAVSMLLAGCDNTPADLHGLPKDAAERATLCGRAALAYTAAGGDKDAAEQKRRQELLQKMVNATDFFSATGLDDAKGKALLGDIQATLAGGNVRVGLEDNLWLEKGVLATNAQLVERATTIIENMGARVITPAEVRARLKLEKRAPVAK